MSAEYLISSLPPIPPDGPVPMTVENFASRCRDQLSARDADGISDLVSGAESNHPIVLTWRDLDTQIRNTIATERALALGVDSSKWRRPAHGCSVYWTTRIASAFQEKDPLKREHMLDLTRYDAAGELTPPETPLSVAAAFTYVIRLAIATKRAKAATDEGNSVFNRLTDISTPCETTKKEETT